MTAAVPPVLRWFTKLGLAWGVLAWLGVNTAQAAVGGTYASPLGSLNLKVRGQKVTGTALGTGGACAFKSGQQVFQGELLEDSVAGTLTVCSKEPGCAPQQSFVVLLIARQGDLLSGAVHLPNAHCAPPMQGMGLALARAAPAPKPLTKKVKPQARPVPPEPSTAPPPNVSQRFEAWTPAAPQEQGPVNHAAAEELAKEAHGLIKTGQFEPARRVILDALAQDPTYAEAYNMMGVTFYARDSYDDALDWYKKALTVNPDFHDAYYNIACIYALEHKKPLAFKYLRVALLNGLHDVAAMTSDPDLDNLREDAAFKELVNMASAATAAMAAGPDAGPTP